MLALALVDIGRKRKKKDGLILVLAFVVIHIWYVGVGESFDVDGAIALALNAINVLALVIRGGGSVPENVTCTWLEIVPVNDYIYVYT